ncbi:MAG: glycosyltransferase [Firmicutes bacterium HGW-Firmicutes-7]|nr:MAG: glycosyltransferase [Firmicutes bacterium HGW-Firmicutes-7]
MEETLEKINDYIISRKKCQHVVLNAGKMVLGHKDHQLKKIINKCEIINADGQSVVWASRFLKSPVPERVAGIDLMYQVIKLAAEKGYKIYFFGAKEEVVQKVAAIYKNKYPTINIVGVRNGYNIIESHDVILEDMKCSKADILFLGFGSPQKEYWLRDNISKIGIPFCMGVGGSFDVVAGLTKRAPLWMQKCGLEWFYRFIQEPKRMWKRYLVGNSKFLYLILREKINIRRPVG